MAFKIRDIFISLGIEADEVAITRIDKGLVNIKTNAKLAGKAFKFMSIAIGSVSVAMGFLIKKAGDFEQTKVAFDTMLGSAERADALLKDLFTLAATTPFQIKDVLKNAKLLLGMGVAADDVIKTMTNLGNVAAGLSVPIGRLALNFGQVVAQGKLTGRELRDFAIAGVPLINELTKNLRVSSEEVTKLVSAGKIGLPDVEEAFRTMATEGGRFADLMIKQSKTLLGMYSNLLDLITIFSKKIGAELLPVAKEILGEFIKFLEANQKLIKSRSVIFFKKLSKILIIIFKVARNIVMALFDMIKAFGGLEKIVKVVTIAFLALVGLQLLSAIGNITLGIWGMVSAMKALKIAATLVNIALAFWPILVGAVVIALGLLIEDIVSFFQGKKSFTSLIVDEFKNMQLKLAPIIGGTIDEIIRQFTDAWSDFKELPFVKFLGGIGSGIGNFAADITSKFGGSPSSSPASSGGNITTSTNVNVNSPISVTVPDGTPPELVGSSLQGGISDALGNLFRDTLRDVQPLVE